MKLFTLFLVLPLLARADVFQVKDLPSYKKCLDTDHLEETTSTATGAQKRYLSHIDIQVRCIESATKFLGGEKNADTLLQYVRATKAVTSPENSLPLVTLLVTRKPAACNEMAVYEVFLKALSYPKSRIDADLVTELKKGVRICLKNAEFRKDFLEEKDNSDSFIKENACEVLKEEKLVGKCEAKA